MWFPPKGMQGNLHMSIFVSMRLFKGQKVNGQNSEGTHITFFAQVHPMNYFMITVNESNHATKKFVS